MNTTERHALYRVDAAKMIRNAPTGTKFYVLISIDLPIEGSPGKVFATCGCGSAPLTRTEAAMLVMGLFDDALEADGARVPLRIETFTYSIGNSVTYWIG